MSMRMAAIAGLLATLALAGCGSATPPLSVSCKGLRITHVTVRNQTSKPIRAILYGPALSLLAHMHPVLPFREVVVAEQRGNIGFTGLVLPTIRPKDPASVTLRFTHAPKGGALALTQTSRIRAKVWAAGDYPHCYIGGTP